MAMNLNTLSYAVYIILLTMLFSCGNASVEKTPQEKAIEHNESAIKTAKKIVQRGDLILRRGDDFISDILADLSPQDKKYSHSGIIDIIDGKPYVISINPASSNYVKDDTIKVEPIDSFIKPDANKYFGVYRYQLTKAEIDSFFTKLDDYKKNKVRFDFKFNLADEENQYCSELIAKSLEKASTQKFKRVTIEETRVLGVKRFFKISDTGIDLKKYPVITIDNLYLNSFTKPIFESDLSTKRSIKL
jgi:Permuted papain-like amidase enzyme, YaeF/YiiX, C92 family